MSAEQSNQSIQIIEDPRLPVALFLGATPAAQPFIPESVRAQCHKRKPGWITTTVGLIEFIPYRFEGEDNVASRYSIPVPPRFVHTQERVGTPKEICPGAGALPTPECFTISDLLTQEFLPHRLTTMNDAVLCLVPGSGENCDGNGCRQPNPNTIKTIGGRIAGGAVH